MNPEIFKNLDFLQLFISKADELNSYSYFEKGDSIVSMHVIKKDDGKFVTTFSNPNNEQKKALLLTLRMFIQQNDRIYYRKILEFYQKLPFSPKWKNEVISIFSDLDMRLDRIFKEGKEPLTRSDIFEIFLYGDEGHLTKRQKYLKINYNEFLEQLNESIFHEVILDYSCAIISLANISRRELQKLGIPIIETL